MSIENIKALAGRIPDAEYAAIVDDLVALEMQRDELLWALKHTKKCLVDANERGVITDTLWVSDSETLFDYIDYVVEKTEGGAA